MKPLVIYHANCADGFGAAFAAWTVLGDGAEYIACKYSRDGVGPSGTHLNWQNKTVSFADREVYILDFSFPRGEMESTFGHANRVVWLDHHKSAFEMWCDTERECYIDVEGEHYTILDNNKSGAILAWEYFHPGTAIPTMIQHIDDYDRWQFKLEGTKAFNKALWSYAPWSFEQWQGMLEDTGFSANDGTGIDAWYREGVAILRAHNQNVQSVVKGSSRKCLLNPAPITGAGIEGLAANCPPHLSSDVGHELATQSGTYGLLWCLSKEGMIAKCSLRSNGDYDVSAIAKALGGGGHRNAAGFEVDIQTLLGWLK